MRWLIVLFKPLVWLFDGLAGFLFARLGISTVRQEQLTSEDIYAVVDAGAQAGVLKQQEHYLIENVFEMQERTVTSAMSPREGIVFFEQGQGAMRSWKLWRKNRTAIFWCVRADWKMLSVMWNRMPY